MSCVATNIVSSLGLQACGDSDGNVRLIELDLEDRSLKPLWQQQAEPQVQVHCKALSQKRCQMINSIFD